MSKIKEQARLMLNNRKFDLNQKTDDVKYELLIKKYSKINCCNG